ncbi:MAG: hypothetical protein WC421_04840 [Elusimicrobiales bacterium]
MRPREAAAWIFHAVTGHELPGGASFAAAARMAAGSPRAVAGAVCAAVALFFVWQTALLILSPHSRWLLQPRPGLDERLKNKFSAPPAPPLAPSLSLEYAAAAGKDAQISKAFNPEDAVEAPPPANARPVKPAKISDRRAAGRGETPGTVVPLLRVADGSFSIPAERLQPPRPAARGAAQKPPQPAATTDGLAAGAPLEKAPQIPRPAPPLPPGHSGMWMETLVLALAPFALSLAAELVKNALAAELLARGAFITSIALAAAGLMELANGSRIWEGLLAAAIGAWQVWMTGKRMTRRFGFTPDTLAGKLVNRR